MEFDNACISVFGLSFLLEEDEQVLIIDFL